MAFNFLAPGALRPLPVRGLKLDAKGRPEQFDFIAHVEIMDADDWANYTNEALQFHKSLRSNDPLSNALSQPNGSRDVALGKKYIKNWTMFSNDEPVDFDEDSLHACLVEPGVAFAFAGAYGEMMGKVLTKTSAKPQRG